MDMKGLNLKPKKALWDYLNKAKGQN